LYMFGCKNADERYDFVDESSDWYDKLWYRLRLESTDGTQVHSKALAIDMH
jgi:hypothetical protein